MRLALALAVLPALPAVAAIDPCHLDQMVSEAETIIQVTDHEVSGPDERGNCLLRGSVARSFRGERALGDEVQISFACANPDMLASGTVYHGAEGVAAAGAVELHLTGRSLTGHGQGLLLLDRPTEAPVFPVETMESC